MPYASYFWIINLKFRMFPPTRKNSVFIPAPQPSMTHSPTHHTIIRSNFITPLPNLKEGWMKKFLKCLIHSKWLFLLNEIANLRNWTVSRAVMERSFIYMDKSCKPDKLTEENNVLTITVSQKILFWRVNQKLQHQRNDHPQEVKKRRPHQPSRN